MNRTKSLLNVYLAIFSSFATAYVSAAEPWSVRGYLGYSELSDQSAGAANVAGEAGSADAALSGGFAAGLAASYRVSPQFAVELGWEYRTNDAEVTLDNNQSFREGNYASNTFAFNGLYLIPTQSQWHPYIGAGLLWIQEIDLDLEQGTVERSFSDSGYTGYQFFAGVNRPLSERWEVHGELRYGAISDIDLAEEGGSGRLTGLDYRPLTLQLGLGYRF